MLTLDRIKEEAMALTDSERAHLAMDLLSSLPHDLDDEDDEWAEIDRRDAELEADPSIGITLEQLAAALGR